MAKYKIVLWDLDDTLVNTKEAMKLVCFDIAREMGIPLDDKRYKELLAFDQNFWRRYHREEISIPQKYIEEKCPQDYLRAYRFQEFFGDITYEQAVLFNQNYETRANYYKPLEGAKEILDYLESLDVELYIATNGPENLAIKKIDVIGISSYIKEIYGYEKLRSSKPENIFFERLFKAIGMPNKEDVLLIGDTDFTDIIGGIKYGIDTCYYNPNNHNLPEGIKSTYQINKLLELKNIIK